MKGPLWFVLGLALGIAVTALVRPIYFSAPSNDGSVKSAKTKVVRSPTHRVEPLQSPAAPDCGQCCDEVAALKRDVASLSATVAMLGGAPSAWPASIPAVTRRDAIEKWLPDALVASQVPGKEIVLDCDEYPCIALIEFEEGVPADSDVVQPLHQAFLEHSNGNGNLTISIFGTSNRNYAALAFPASDDTDTGPGSRTSVRTQALFDANSP